MVLWGANTTHVYRGSDTPAGGAPATPPASGSTNLFGGASTPAPAAPLFGSTTPSTPTFGSSPAPGLFGASAPAPSTGLFGSTPAPSSSTGLFGSSTTPAPAPLFGSSATPAPAPLFGGGTTPAPAPLFGSTTPAPAPLFGSTTPAPAPLFGAAPAPAFGAAFGAAPQQQQQQQQQIPAQAAMQAHMDASARQEQARLMVELEKLNAAYTGASVDDKTVPFVTIVYDDITPQQLQLQWLHRSHGGLGLVPPPKPAQVSEREWLEACVRNPNPEKYMPVMLLGADALRMRVVWQQERAKSLATGASQLREAHETMRSKFRQYQDNVQHLARTHAALRKRLLNVMRKVEVVRCINLPVQAAEVQASQQLSQLLRSADQVAATLAALQDQIRHAPIVSTAPSRLPDEGKLQEVFQQQGQGIETLTEVMQKDMRDIHLLKQRVGQQSIAAPPRL